MKSQLGFKEQLSEEISYHGLSNKEFAAKLNISINTLNMYLYRDSIPSADIAVKMADTLNTSVEYLITGHDGGSKIYEPLTSSPRTEPKPDPLLSSTLPVYTQQGTILHL